MKKNLFISGVIGVFTGFLNGLFGSGGGTVVVPCLERFLDVEEHKAHASAIAIILPLSILSAFMYTRNTKLEWFSILTISAGGMVGGYIGAKLLTKISAKWLHKIFGAFMIVAAVRMIV